MLVTYYTAEITSSLHEGATPTSIKVDEVHAALIPVYEAWFGKANVKVIAKSGARRFDDPEVEYNKFLLDRIFFTAMPKPRIEAWNSIFYQKEHTLETILDRVHKRFQDLPIKEKNKAFSASYLDEDNNSLIRDDEVIMPYTELMKEVETETSRKPGRPPKTDDSALAV